MYRDVDYAWAAGFFDGEGCVIIYNKYSGKTRSPVYGLRITVAQNMKQPLEKLLAMFGGFMSKQPWTKGCWFWHCSTNKAREALKKMLPYLQVKEEEARVGIEFQDHVNAYRSYLVPKGRHNVGRWLPDEVIVHRESLKLKLQEIRSKNHGNKPKKAFVRTIALPANDIVGAVQ